MVWDVACGAFLAGDAGGWCATNANGVTCIAGMYNLGLTTTCDVEAAGGACEVEEEENLSLIFVDRSALAYAGIANGSGRVDIRCRK